MNAMNYLDHAATTPVRPEVIETMIKMMKEDFGNPSSLHRMGLSAEKALGRARREIAEFLGCQSDQIIFTSGGTEGNNLGMRGGLPRQIPPGKNVCIGAIEHTSVFQVAKELEKQGIEVRLLPVDYQGRILMDQAETCFDKDTMMVSVQHVNNEIGTIQPVEDLLAKAKQANPQVHFHVDGVQAVGKIPVSLKGLKVDSYAFSGHKINASKGTGAVFIRDPKAMRPVLWGSSQERGLRPGTENVPAICGLATAVACLAREFQSHQAAYIKSRNLIMDQLKQKVTGITINTPADLAWAAPHILSVSIQGVKAEILLHMLEMDQIYVSTGSACSSKLKGNRILRQMGIAHDRVDGTIRISCGWDADEEAIQTALKGLVAAIEEVRELTMR
jgi:cysteine desulfurase